MSIARRSPTLGRSLVLAACLWLGLMPASRADDLSVILLLDLDSGGNLHVSLDAPGRLNPSEAARALSDSLGCRNARFAGEISAGDGTAHYELTGTCPSGLVRGGLMVQGNWDLAPL